MGGAGSGIVGFGITSVAVYAIDAASACKTFQAARNAIVNCAVIWPGYSLMSSSVKQLEVLSTKFKIRYDVSEHRFQGGSSGEQVFLKSRDISYGRVGSAGSVLLWDCVDEDALYPLKKTTAVTRSTVGA